MAQELVTEKPDFGIYSMYLGKRSACGYYRVEVPLRGIFQCGLGNAFIDKGSGDRKAAYACMLSSDAIVFFSPASPSVMQTVETIRNMRPGRSDDGKALLFPPSMIFDVDDNIDWVHPFNQAFVRLGTRSINGEVLKKDDMITALLPDGKEDVIWKDKETIVEGETVNFEENKQRVRMIHEVARRMDAVTVPSKYLARYYREHHGCTDVYVFPNSVIPSDYPSVNLAPREGVRILWQGGGSHMPDWYPLRDAVRAIALKYPQVTFVIWGSAYRYIHNNIPENQVEFRDWVDYEAYKPMRMIVDADINLCPLIDNEFNRSKSAIKWYEASMPNKPEATLAARVSPYSDEIEDGVTGLLYDGPKDFVEKLSVMIENVEMRKRLADQARTWVMTHRHFEKTVPPYFEFLRELRERKREALVA